MKKCAAFILVCIICGIFFDILSITISAEEDNGQIIEESTHIRSIIPFVERVDNEVVQNVPIESQSDILDSPGTVSLRLQVYIDAADARTYHSQNLYICKLRTYEDITQVSAENVARSFEVLSNEGFTYTLDILTDFSNVNNGEIYNKFVVAARNGEELVPISDARYIDNINHLSNRRDTPPDSRSKKGLAAIQMPGEARLLGVRHTTVKIVLNDFMAAEPSANTFPAYMFGGEEFYFNMDVIAEYDRRIKYLTNEGINVTAVLVISAGDYIHPQFRESVNDYNVEDDDADTGEELDEEENGEEADNVPDYSNLEPIDHIIHKGALENPAAKPFYFGINTADENGFKYFAALMSFIADRYMREGHMSEDIGSGRIYNIILGSEIGNINMNYCGQIDIEQYARDYLRALRIADAAARSRFGGARVYVPLDNSFAYSPDGGYINKQIIDLLCEYSAQEGNFIWNVAVHAYNADRYSPEVWRETLPVNNFDTPYITMKNINVLVDYLNLEKQAYLPDGETRKIMLAGQGFTSGGVEKEGMELQAASFVYAYLKAKYIPEIIAFIYHGQTDNPSEEVGYFGLWKESGAPKFIHDIFKYIDTSKEAEYIEFAKAILNIESFEEISPLYSADTGHAVILTETTGKANRSRMNRIFIGRFTGAELSGFIGSANMGDISLEVYDGESAFTQALFAGFNAPKRGDFGSIFKIYEPDNYLDLSERRFVEVNMRIDSDLNLEAGHTVQIILMLEAETEDGLHVYEGIANIKLNEDSEIYFDISEWDGRANISRLALAANPYSELYADSGGYDFRMYVQSITSANPSSFNIMRNIIIAGVILFLVVAALWAVLFIRARMIRKRRRREREEQRRKRQAAARRRALAGRQPPPKNPGSSKK